VSWLDHPLVRRARKKTALQLFRRLHRITHRLPVKLREVERSRLLVVAPHFDDEAIGAGGTLALHARVGSEIDVVYCAAGATPKETVIRKAEAAACAEQLGFRHVETLDGTQGSLSLEEPALAERLRATILRTQRADIRRTWRRIFEFAPCSHSWYGNPSRWFMQAVLPRICTQDIVEVHTIRRVAND
jgi:hypothetical protein